MMSLWEEKSGTMVPVTILQFENSIVVGHRTSINDGYNALLIGEGKNLEPDSKKDRFCIHYSRNAGLDWIVKKIGEFRVSSDGFIPVGSQVNATHFTSGQKVDIKGKNKDKGFQGVMKRWGFHGQSRTHGVSKTHRSAGSTGKRKWPGKVFKGKKMAGHMGGINTTVQNATVVKVDSNLNILFVKGSIPGPNGSIVKVTDAIKSKYQFDPYVNPPPFPTTNYLKKEQDE
jgi:large subunit ribosomal protein L3